MAEVKEEKNIDISETLSKTEHYIEENRKTLTIIIGALVLVVVGYLLYSKVYIGGKEKDARAQMFIAEQYFRGDSLRLAVQGDGNYPGFEDIANDYGAAPSGNLAKLYLGMSHLRMGKYQEAIDVLKGYDGNDMITSSLELSAMGDAYMELNQVDDAISSYKKASGTNPNNFTTPIILMKLGHAYESKGDYENAAQTYEQIKKDYPRTNEGMDAEKYIARAKAKVK
jgi:TolA-binding protein